jgi:class 3 adenylate cyclase/YHS domain-containing protein
MATEQAADLAVAFALLASECLGPGDRLIKPIGDAVLVVSPTPSAAIDLVGRPFAATVEIDGCPLARAGLHHGPVMQRDGDMFGASVSLAARVAGQAVGGQTHLTTAIADAARTQGLNVSPLGSVELRNIRERVSLYDIGLDPTREASAVDPVCRMWVSHREAAGQLRANSSTYWFCSLECVVRFASNPHLFASSH